MNLGGPELLVILLFVIAGLVVPIYAAVRAFNNGDNGWGIGILIAMFVPLGFVLGLVYLAQQGSRTSSY